MIVGWALKFAGKSAQESIKKMQSVFGTIEKVLNLPVILGRLGYVSVADAIKNASEYSDTLVPFDRRK